MRADVANEMPSVPFIAPVVEEKIEEPVESRERKQEAEIAT
jgi:hypothetical protein